MSSTDRYRFGPFVLDAGERALSRDGRPVRLTPKDVDVLLALVERHGALVTRERLFAEVWPGVVVEDCNLARHVATLRQSLGDAADAPTYIETVPKRGYRFVAPVAPALPPDPAAAAASPAPSPAGAPAPEHRPTFSGCSVAGLRRAEEALATARPLRLARRAGRWLAHAAVALAGASAVWLVSGRTSEERAFAAGPIRSLAVLQVENLTGDPRHEHLAAELGELIVNDLAHLRELEVVSRSEARRFAGSSLPSRVIGRELGVDGLLEAAIVRLDDRLRITAELVDTRTERLVWAEVFEGGADDVLELQDLIAEAVAEAVGLPEGPAGGQHPLRAGGATGVAAAPASLPR